MTYFPELPVDRQPQPVVVEPISHAVPLTPGTPLPPGRAVWVAASAGAIVLILSQGGSISIPATSAGAGTILRDLSVVDADLSGATNASVSILY